MNALLEVSDLRAGYGPLEVLHGIDLTVAAGDLVAILGPNGAGKSTLLSAIAGLHPITSGSVRLAGIAVSGARPDDLARAGLCLIPEGRGVFPNLTVAEHLRMAAHSGRPLAVIENETFERFPRLAEKRHQTAGTMSGGEQQMLALARGLATDPAVLLLDELSMGLAPLIVEELYSQVVAITATGVSVIVVEQFAHIVLGVADLAAVLVRGRLGPLLAPSALEGGLSAAYLGSTPIPNGSTTEMSP